MFLERRNKMQVKAIFEISGKSVADGVEFSSLEAGEGVSILQVDMENLVERVSNTRSVIVVPLSQSFLLIFVDIENRVEIPDIDYRPVFEAILTGRKIQAIKELRTATGFGLKESKQFVDKVYPMLFGERYVFVGGDAGGFVPLD
jgi:hypothetical protein